MPLFGTEIEYGISVPGRPAVDADALASAVVDAWDGAGTPTLGTANRVLGNGARLYVDHGHVEYATPEVTSASEAVRYELAGDLIARRASELASRSLGAPIHLYRNNTDGKGSAYGYHENHLLRRSTPWATVVAALPAFLVTRILFTGAGRLGLGPRSELAGFQLSQRADFFTRLTSLDTTRDRGLINTRDEPHARPSQWRRLHVITGDSTSVPWASWLKIGTLGLVLAALEAGELPVIELADPVAAFRSVSRLWGRPLALAEGRTATALDVQNSLWEACHSFVARHSYPEGEELIAAWREVLDDLPRGASAVADRVEWAARWLLLDAVRRRDGLVLDEAKLRQLDLAWADIDPASSPRAVLERAGRFRQLPVDAASAVTEPPADTRAWLRGLFVTRYPDAVVAALWDSLLVKDTRGGLHTLRMSDPYGSRVRAEANLSGGLDMLIHTVEETSR